MSGSGRVGGTGGGVGVGLLMLLSYPPSSSANHQMLGRMSGVVSAALSGLTLRLTVS